MTDFDVAVVGAGPAGSSSAYYLARAGLRVILLDRAKFPRIKPCGGGITARAYIEAPTDLTPVIERRINRVRFSYRQGDDFQHEYPETLVYMTQRHRLDAYLAGMAVEAGAEFHDDEGLSSLAVERDGVALTVNNAEMRARVIIGADGANGVVARHLGLQPVTERQVALEANFPFSASAPLQGWEDMLALDLGSVPGGYSWSFPKQDHFNVGSGGWHKQGHRLRAHLQKVRSHYDLDKAEMLNLQGHHLPIRSDGRPISSGPALLVGDAAGLIDPMSGEGIYAAFVSARLAARSIENYISGLTDNLKDYDAAVERELMGDIRAARKLRDAYDYIPRASYFALRHSSFFRNMLCRLMTGEGSYQSFLRRLGPAKNVVNWLSKRGELARAAV